MTLTAGGDVPPTVSYQWQEDAGSGWTDLGATTTSPTKEVTSARRGTRKFRVEVRNAGVTVQSEPTHVTWDEWAIVADMIGELSEGVASSSAYLRDQSALMGCMRATSTSPGSGGGRSVTGPLPATIATFDDLLASYTGDVKAKMEDTGANGCATQSNAMFSTNESEARAKLARLKAGNAVYAKLLDTPHGRQFEASLGTSNTLRQDATILADVLALDETGDTGSTATSSVPKAGGVTHGFESCLPTDTDPSRPVKFATLNCLQFEKSHRLWVILHGDQAKQTALKRDLDRYEWLQYDNFACSNWILPDPGQGLPCMKHDIPYASLQVMIPDDGTPAATLDIAWNPRNKYLADHLLLVDGICGMRVGELRRKCIPEAAEDHSIVETLLKVGWWLPKITYFGVGDINHKGWPITKQDAVHAKRNFEYLSCDVPKVDQVVIEHISDRTFEASWSLNQGCVQDITVHLYRLCYDVTYSNSFIGLLSPNSRCKKLHVADSPARFDAPVGTRSVTLASMQIYPANRINDRVSYPELHFESERPVYRD